MRFFATDLLSKKDLVGVEVGVWRGDHAKQILDAFSMKKLHLVDPYDANAEHPNMPQETYDENKVVAINLMNDNPKVKWHFKKSVDAAKKFKDCSLDFVYIDGDHRTESVIADIEAWLPKIKKDGMLAGHDYNYESVTIGINNTIGRTNLKTDGFDWVYII